jgi:hypothetical protein
LPDLLSSKRSGNKIDLRISRLSLFDHAHASHRRMQISSRSTSRRPTPSPAHQEGAVMRLSTIRRRINRLVEQQGDEKAAPRYIESMPDGTLILHKRLKTKEIDKKKLKRLKKKRPILVIRHRELT